MKHLFTAYLIMLSAELAAQIEPILESKKIDDNLYFLRPETRIANSSSLLSVGEDGVLLIDASHIDVSELIMEEVRKYQKNKIDLIVNTHYHADHSQGMEFFGRNSVIITTDQQRKRLTEQDLIGDGPLKEEGWPNITFKDSLTLFFNGEEILLMRPPYNGHTDGDVLIYFKQSKVLCVGDYLFLDKFPLIDYEEGGGDVENYFKNIQWILESFPSDTRFIPGHGTWYPADIEVVSHSRYATHTKLVESSLKIIQKKIDEGKTLDVIIQEGLPDKFKILEEKPRFLTIERWIKQIYNYYK